MTAALEGVRVVEMGGWMAAPGAGAMMADLGADVIKVEPLHGDAMRGATGGARHLFAGVGAQTGQIELGAPSTDPAVVAKMIDDIEAVYGVGEEVYQQLAARRDRRTKAVLKALKDTP